MTISFDSTVVTIVVTMASNSFGILLIKSSIDSLNINPTHKSSFKPNARAPTRFSLTGFQQFKGRWEILNAIQNCKKKSGKIERIRWKKYVKIMNKKNTFEFFVE